LLDSVSHQISRISAIFIARTKKVSVYIWEWYWSLSGNVRRKARTDIGEGRYSLTCKSNQRQHLATCFSLWHSPYTKHSIPFRPRGELYIWFVPFYRRKTSFLKGCIWQRDHMLYRGYHGDGITVLLQFDVIIII